MEGLLNLLYLAPALAKKRLQEVFCDRASPAVLRDTLQSSGISLCLRSSNLGYWKAKRLAIFIVVVQTAVSRLRGIIMSSITSTSGVYGSGQTATEFEKREDEELLAGFI